MANKRRRKRLKGVAVYLPRALYDAWLEYLSAKELALAMLPTSENELIGIEPGDRSEFSIVYMQMPSWWHEWYKSLDKEDKFRFGKLILKRLKSVGLVGSSI
jgi:hypothetical protein